MKLKDMLSPEELDLLKKLSPAPKCMHDPSKMNELSNPPRWKCGQCGMIAKQIMPSVPYLGSKPPK